MRPPEEALLAVNTLLCTSGWPSSLAAVRVRMRGGDLGPVCGARPPASGSRVFVDRSVLAPVSGCVCSPGAARRCLTARTKASADRQLVWEADLPWGFRAGPLDLQ